MIKQKEFTGELIEIDLTGPAGNIYYLLGCAEKLALRGNEDYKKIKNEMQASDYINAVIVFERYFGEFVLLLASEPLFEEIECRRQSDSTD